MTSARQLVIPKTGDMILKCEKELKKNIYCTNNHPEKESQLCSSPIILFRQS